MFIGFLSLLQHWLLHSCGAWFKSFRKKIPAVFKADLDCLFIHLLCFFFENLETEPNLAFQRILIPVSIVYLKESLTFHQYSSFLYIKFRSQVEHTYTIHYSGCWKKMVAFLYWSSKYLVALSLEKLNQIKYEVLLAYLGWSCQDITFQSWQLKNI